MRYLIGLFLIAHGLIHAAYVSPAPRPTPGAPEWPFAMERSWLVTAFGVDAGLVRVIGTALVAVAVLGFLLSGLTWLGIGIPREWWPPLAVTAAVASILVLVLFFHPWIVLGLAIDLVVLWVIFGPAAADATIVR